ncbi:uncharacterized protein I303_106380 [Kwoniella dejecticola CBS 10117]|uniref:Glutamate-1-semialdehyde 2,1-aminomutase n=1 Tax=Kwoniella dejecticola CBS 10117 TaxID=1296121 RepID=A0A1A5ZUV8_9TREE|nr:uncharacterized protein I303_08363 [Kwoniella dejecticola CBS 10117]OBR81592.1 hypothetical protein I303_08363 [Kwoniella dejecticola CBS 10117]
MTVPTTPAAPSAYAGPLKVAQTEYAQRNPRSYEAWQEATLSLPGGGTRSSIFVHPFPLFIERGEGKWVFDLDGHQYQDFVSDFTSGIYGKSNPILKDAITRALDNGLQLGAHTKTESLLASELCARFPSIDLVRFANSGTEANILAISIGLEYTRRKKVVVFKGGYHGSVLSHFGEDDGGDLKVPYDFLVCPYNDISGTRDAIEQHKDDIGVILVEPMLGAGGCHPGTPDFLQGLRDLADEIGAVLIFDEVQTARLSTGGRQKILGITPDMTTLGKFFGGGFAFGAFGGKREIMSLFDARHPQSIAHGSTFNNSPLTMIAGLTAVQKILTQENLDKLNQMGDEFRENVNLHTSQNAIPFSITGLGSINQVHFHPSTDGSQTQSQTQMRKEGLDLFYFKLLEKGYWISQRGLISLNFEMTREDVKAFEKAVIDSIDQVYACRTG